MFDFLSSIFLRFTALPKTALDASARARLTSVDILQEAYMRDIEMKFDKNEFALLARLAYIGAIAAEEGLPDEANEKVEELLDRILQIAHTSKIIDGISYDAELKKYFTDAETEEFLLEPFDEFVENSFWDELTARLAQQALIKKIGEKAFLELPLDERVKAETELEEEFSREFEEHGLENLTLKK